jgi:hypothetical protein
MRIDVDIYEYKKRARKRELAGKRNVILGCKIPLMVALVGYIMQCPGPDSDEMKAAHNADMHIRHTKIETKERPSV